MIIGLHGKAGAGKDAFADRLVESHGFVKRGFADPLYEEVAHAFRVNVGFLRSRPSKEIPQPELRLARCYDSGFADFMHSRGESVNAERSPRWVLQQWGTEYRRAQSLTYWVDQLMRFIGGAWNDGAKGVVIPDCRFLNEAEWVLAHGGRVIEIRRPGLAAVNDHTSEAALPPRLVSTRVFNDGTLEDLHAQADNVMGTRVSAEELA